MPLGVTIKTDRKIEQLRAALQAMPRWMPAVIRTHLPPLGERVVEVMQAEIEPHRYTGELSDSIVSEYDDGEYAVSVHPTAMRGGKHDAGVLLELGTDPIPGVPWAPIKAWADFRGIPAFPVWMSIRTRGVKPHPFLQRTLDSSEGLIAETARRMAEDVAQAVLTGTGTESVR